ncbi:nucleotidyltransferase domain-containing protein [Promicromonospora soli]
MDWDHPEHVFGSSLEPVVLRVLWRTTSSMTGAQVHRLANTGSDQGVRRALERLVEFGIVRSRQAGRAILYSLNREHLLFPAVDGAFRALHPTQSFRTIVQEIVTSHFPTVPETVSVALFGSVARGDARLDSDVDLLVIAPDSYSEPAQGVADDLRALEPRIGQWVQVYLTDPDRLRHAVETDDPIVQSFRDDCEQLHGPDVRTYLQGTR